VPVGRPFQTAIVVGGARKPIVDKDDAVTNERFVCDLDAGTDECVALNLDPLADGCSLLNLDKRANQAFVADGASIEVAEAHQPYALTELHIRGNGRKRWRLHRILPQQCERLWLRAPTARRCEPASSIKPLFFDRQ